MRQHCSVVALSRSCWTVFIHACKGEREFDPVLGRVFGVDGGRGREGVGLMKKNVAEWCKVSSSIMWVRVLVH